MGGCARDAQVTPGYVMGFAASLDACKLNCQAHNCRFMQFHTSNWCGLFETCPLTRPASDYSSPAQVFQITATAAPTTANPTPSPTMSPTLLPTLPTSAPTLRPTTESPTGTPTSAPTQTAAPTLVPTPRPTPVPTPQLTTQSPTTTPTPVPTQSGTPPPTNNTLLSAYWDNGECGPEGNNHNWE